MSKQLKIENGNNNNQAARDITIINNNSNIAETFIMGNLASFVPKLQEDFESVRSDIREIFNQQVTTLKQNLEKAYSASKLQEEVESIGSEFREIVNQRLIIPFERDLEKVRLVPKLQEEVESIRNEFREIVNQRLIIPFERDSENSLGFKLQKETESIGSQIRETINQQVINPLKRDLEKENINHHLSILREQLKYAEYSKPKENSKHENIERIEIVNDWIEGMEKISQEEEELSLIWEGWYIDFYEGKKTSDLQLILNKMKNLSSKEAITLLNLNDKEALRAKKKVEDMDKKNNMVKNFLFRPVRLEVRKEQYLYEQLLKKELIEKDTTHKRLIPLMTMGALYFFITLVLLLYKQKHNYPFDTYLLDFIIKNSSLLMIIIALLSLIVVGVPYIIGRYRKYQRTWIGEEIVSYARKIKFPKNNE